MKYHVDQFGINDKALEIIESAMQYGTRALSIPKTVRVVIYGTNSIRKTDRNTQAECEQITGKLYTIKLARNTVRGLSKGDHFALAILFHELVHIKQFVSGKLKFTRRANKILWKGKDITNIDYESDPSEIEAFEKGDKLATRFLNSFEWE